MDTNISREMKKRVGAFLKSPDFDEYFRQLHSFSHPALIASWLVMPFLLQGDASAGAWKKLSTGDVRSSGLRRRYRRLAETGEIIFTYVLVCNADLKRKPGMNAPALVIGNFNDGLDDSALLDLREKLAGLALGQDVQPSDRKVAKLLRDLDYSFRRRRHLPLSYTGGVQIVAFDLMILGAFLPTDTLRMEAIPCIAEPGKRGLIAMIPYFIIEDVLEEQRGQTQQQEPAKRVESVAQLQSQALSTSARTKPHPQHEGLSLAFIPKMLEESTRALFLAMRSPQANDLLSQVWTEFGEKNLTPENVLPPKGLSVSAFQHGKYLGLCFVFPTPEAVGEAYYGLAVAGPSDDWKTETRQTIPYRYFLLMRALISSAEVVEWTSGGVENLGPSHVSIPPDFVIPILRRFYGYEDDDSIND